MSEVQLVIREAEHDWSGSMQGDWAESAIAALSADPVTLAELEAACARFNKPTPNRSFFTNLRAGLRTEPYDAGLVVIDLVARLVLVDSAYSSPRPTGEICYHDGNCTTDKWLRYHLAEDWLFINDQGEWRAVAEQRRRDRAARPPLDARSVFYGRPLLEFIARETFAAAPHPEADAATDNDSIRQIHAAWLLTPREDLNGACPREVALERRNHHTWDLQDQCERWSRLRASPPVLDKSSFAFRFAGFGTHELVKYYDLIRELLWSCRERLAHLKATQADAGGPDTLTIGDFLASEIPRLESLRDEWFEAPDPEFHGRTPRYIIDRERARLPEVMSKHEGIVDPDCPCCQMLADMPGPMFWNLDGCNMDDDFAFDMSHRTREEWEAERRKWEEHSRRFNAQMEERKRLGVTDPRFAGGSAQSVFSSSFSVGDMTDLPLGIRLFGIGGHLAELIVDIRGRVDGSTGAPESQQIIDRLNRDFGNLREILQSAEPSLTEALIDPVIDRFTESLASVASSRPDLEAKCLSLTISLRKFLKPHSPEPTWDSGDLDTPF